MLRGTLTFGWILALFFTATVSFNSQAQTSQSGYPSTWNSQRFKSKGREFAAAEQAQRTTAIWIITSLVNESEKYESQTLRVRTQARAADALWSVDEALARSLFLRAWKIAETVDEAAEEATEEAKKNALRSRVGSVTMVPPLASLRSEVLGFAARRDPILGNFLIAKLDQAKSPENASANPAKASSDYSDPTEPRLAIAKRLEVALQLLNAGAIKQAKAFADPALDFATSPGIIFLCLLRQKDPDGADKLYDRLLARAAIDPSAEATTVSLLSSYVLTPNYLVTATRNGRVSNQFGDTTQSYDLPPRLRARFFSVAASILTRPPQPPEQDLSLAGRAGTYFTIARLLPMFEVHAPNYLPALNTQLSMLAVDAPETFRNGQDAMLRVGLVSANSGGDTISNILDQLQGAATSAERDTIYVKAIREGAGKDDPRIRQFAGKIEDDNLRERARSFADLAIVRNAISKKDLDAALGILRNGYLVSLHRVWAMAEMGSLLRSTDSAGALLLLDEANVEAHRIDMGDPNRVYALSCVAAAFLAVDRFRSWSVAADVVKAANAVPGYTGEDGRLSARLRSKGVIAVISVDEPSFNIGNLFELLARDDLQLALSTANGFSGDASRAGASLAVARSVLDKQRSRAIRKSAPQS
jgi:hypothetical protein